MTTTILCPECNAACPADSAEAGGGMTCPHCGNEFTALMASLPQTVVACDTPPRPEEDPGAVTATGPTGLIGSTLGGCRIDRKLGQGGMGIVFKGHHLALDIPVALKVLPPQFTGDQAAIERFVREARAAARLKHSNIVGVLNVGEEQGFRFIVMEYVSGRNLQDILHEKGLMDSREALLIIRQVAEALKMAHKNGIIHRDIKPGNILVNDEGEAQLADLGLAKQINVESSGELTQSGTAMGTPYYISPEQVKDAKTADIRSDIYSLGCTLYHMLCGVVPYSGSSFYEILDQHMRSEIPDPKDTNPKVTDSVANLIRKMMAKDATARHQTPDDLLADLDRVLSGGDLATAQTAKPNRQRSTMPIALVSALALILVIGVGVLAGMWSRGTPPTADTPGTPASSGTNTEQTQPIPDAPDTSREPIAATAQEAFRQAQRAEEAGKYAEAGERYLAMAQTYPADDRADDALLLRGKLQAGHLSEPREALKTLRSLLLKYPKTEHSPEALFVTAVCVERLVGPGERAVATYRRVVEAIPNTEFGQRAEKRMQQLQQE